jgi:hypothetical protein
MCNGGGPPKIIITFSATTAVPHPPGISDGETTLPPGGPNDKKFTTAVKPGQQVQFKVAGDISAIASITEGEGSDIFETDPTAANDWTGTVGKKLENDDTREYTVCYNVNNAPANPYCQDPQLKMKR